MAYQENDDPDSQTGISPFFRPTLRARKTVVNFPKNNYSNYMAKKRVRMAHTYNNREKNMQMMDLRRKLIHQRTSRAGLDLRWKLVALVLSRMRTRHLKNRRFNPYKVAQQGGFSRIGEAQFIQQQKNDAQ